MVGAPSDNFSTSGHLRTIPLNEVFADPTVVNDFIARTGDKDPEMKCLVRRQGPSVVVPMTNNTESGGVPTCYHVGNSSATDSWDNPTFSLSPDMERAAANWITAAMEKHAAELLSPAVLDKIVVGPNSVGEL